MIRATAYTRDLLVILLQDFDNSKRFQVPNNDTRLVTVNKDIFIK